MMRSGCGTKMMALLLGVAGAVWFVLPAPAGVTLSTETNAEISLSTRVVSTSNEEVEAEYTLDRFHSQTHRTVQRYVETVDRWFTPEGEEPKPASPVRLRVGVNGEMDLHSRNDSDWRAQVDLSIDASMPDFEDRLRLFITTVDYTVLPGSETISAGRVLRLGLSRLWSHGIGTTIGIKSGLPPELYAQAAWSTVYSNRLWKFYPQQVGYWESGEGFGEITSLVADRWSGKWDFRTVSAIRWGEDRMASDNTSTNGNHGWQWEQTFIMGYFRELFDEREYGRLAGGNDLARGGGVRFSLFGGPSSVDIMRLTLFHKAPLYSRWLYYSIALEAEKSEEANWDPEYRFTIGLEALFWGTGKR